MRVEIRDRRRYPPASSGPVVQCRLLQRREEEAGFLVRFRGDDGDPEHDVGLGELRRRAEALPVDRDRLHHHRRRKMRGEGERQTEDRGELGAIGARPEDPDRDLEPGAGNRLHGLVWFGGLEVAHQLDDILGKLVAAEEGSAHRPGGDLVRPGGAAEAQLDPSGMQRGEGAELFGDHQRGVVRQHDAAGADADAGRAGGDMGERHRGRRAGDAGQVVMLGHPVAPVAEPLDMAREVERIAQRLAGVAAFGDRGEIENGEWDHLMTIAPDGVKRKAALRSPSIG